jgi:hypothetical protein
MALTIIDQFGELLANGLDVVETGEGHVAVEIGGRGALVSAKVPTKLMSSVSRMTSMSVNNLTTDQEPDAERREVHQH